MIIVHYILFTLIFLVVLEIGLTPLYIKARDEYHGTEGEIPYNIPIVNLFRLCYYKYQIHKRKNVRYMNK